MSTTAGPAVEPAAAQPTAPEPTAPELTAAELTALEPAPVPRVWLPRLARPLGRTGLAAFIILGLVTLMFGVATSSFTLETVLQLVGFAAFAVVGTILLEQAAHPIGWICLAIGLGGAITGLAQEYLFFTDIHLGSPGREIAALIEAFIGFPAVVLAFTFLPLLFPDGRLPSRRWRFVAWLAAADIALFIVAFGLTPRGLFSLRRNPIGIIPEGKPTELVLDAVGIVTIVTGALCALALLVRYLGAGPDVRQQLKWVAAAVAVFAISLIVSIATGIDTFAWVLPVLPIAVGIAILRYRLYDIDMFIARALVYIPLTAVLAGAYAASVALFQRVFVSLTGQSSDAAIVITTLILASVFTPVRKALENAVDRRFRPAAALAPVSGVTDLTPRQLDAHIAAVARMVLREELAHQRADAPDGRKRA
ncbi:MAG TPA: hypothetical protein VHL56_02740 [Candidatus Limnocylindrales bacterium]|nr:hypothetical protein [Candidatus Limnocylindrales bacterium]